MPPPTKRARRTAPEAYPPPHLRADPQADPQAQNPPPEDAPNDKPQFHSKTLAKVRDLIAHTATTSLLPALRTAKQNERQKLGRRLKEATTPSAREKVLAETQCLKTLDLGRLAGAHLTRTLGKIKSISVFVSAATAESQGFRMEERGKEGLNVSARLLGSQGVRDAVSTIVPRVRGKVARLMERESTFDDAENEDEDDGEALPNDAISISAASDDISVSDSDDGLPQLQAGYISYSSASSEIDYDSDGGGSLPRSRHPAAGPGQQPKRTNKNHRGQRARQKIWAKKYGANARHLYSSGAAVEEGKGELKGVHASRLSRVAGAVSQSYQNQRQNQSQDERGARKRTFDSHTQSQPGRGGVAQNKTAANGDDEDAPLHPSWQAAKRAREAPMPKFGGERITFS